MSSESPSTPFIPVDDTAVPASGRLGAAHPLAAWAWAVLGNIRSVADKMLVLNACDRRLGRGSTSEKQEQAYNAVALFVADVGHVPHATEWDAWRVGSTERRGLPSASFIRNAFGGWAGLRASFETVPEVDVLSTRLTARGPSFATDEHAAVLAAWAAATEGPLRWEGLLAWLKADGPAEAGISRAPREVQTLMRGYRSFEVMLEAAGLGDRSVAELGRRPRRATERWIAPQELRASLLDNMPGVGCRPARAAVPFGLRSPSDSVGRRASAV